MKVVLSAVFLLLLMFPFAYGQDFYDIETVNTIELTFQQSNWDYILDSLFELGDEYRLIGTAVINGQFFDSVGVRYKGHSSYSANRVKNPFNIKLDYIIENQLYQNYGTIKLANGFSDPSFVRETLAYEIARKYMPASKANYINVYVNGALIGLYTNVQAVDKYFLNNFFYYDDNPLFKDINVDGFPPKGCINSSAIWGYLGDDSSCYVNDFEMKSDSGWSELMDFLYVLSYQTSYLEDEFDIDRQLWVLAFDILLINLDSQVAYQRNFYLYQVLTGQFTPMVWDLNMCFGGMKDLGGGGGPGGGSHLDLTGMQHLDPFVHADNSNFPAIKNVLSNTTHQKMFIAHMKTIMEENISNGWYETRANYLQTIIDDDVQADPNKFYSYTAFLTNVDNSYNDAVGITQLMEGRESYLSGLSEFTATQPSFRNIGCTPASPEANTTVSFTADVSNATSVMLAYRQILDGVFDEAIMYDDGAHNDGAAGDGTYGVSVAIATGDINYYVYAKNSNAGAFSPEHAAFEFYTAEVSAPTNSDIYINEFLASNATTYADQNGEYDDWIELYNSTDDDISLNGYYLTDDLAEPDQWIFPDTFIAANGYLLIWADDDGEQEGLHANFKISASGESLILSNPSLTVLDQITFGAQTEDVSYGRYPDGADNWIEFTVPTPDASNTLAINEPPEFEWTVYTPNRPTSTQSVYVQTKVTDDNGLTDVSLKYEAGSGYITRTMYDDGNHHDSLAGDNIYGTSIPGYSNMTWVSFYIEAADDSAAVTLEPEAIQLKYQIIDLPSIEIRINEIMAENDTTIVDPDSGGGYPDWFELYNPGGSTVNLEGYYLTDDLTEPAKWAIPAGVTIDPGEYLLFRADNDEEQGPTHTNFKLSSDGEYLGLFDTDANGNTAIDIISFSLQQSDLSMGHCPDDTGDWQFLSVATPGSTNCVTGYICGDSNSDLRVNVSDAVFIINYVFSGGNAPCDTDGDSQPDC